TVATDSGTHQVDMVNSSIATWTFSSLVSDNPEFVLDTTGLPTSLAPGQTTTLGVRFHPVAAGPRTGLLKISFQGTTSQAVVSLSGTGLADEPPPHQGCGCASSGGTSAMAGLLALAAALKRRRRRARAA
ncbi:MAG TPA: MYXO-CTERM sorting domain-containing protein, partial [Myxococcales bacterium]|nr:MYXO-CTERM sorting domain-containing protein [Myxococcales bacterium]